MAQVDMTGSRIYVADDVAANRALLATILGRGGFSDVQLFPDGAALLDAVDVGAGVDDALAERAVADEHRGDSAAPLLALGERHPGGEPVRMDEEGVRPDRAETPVHPMQHDLGRDSDDDHQGYGNERGPDATEARPRGKRDRQCPQQREDEVEDDLDHERPGRHDPGPECLDVVRHVILREEEVGRELARGAQKRVLEDDREGLRLVQVMRGHEHGDAAARQLVDQLLKQSGTFAAREIVPGYIGFDPTAASLHVGSLVPVMAMAWLQRLGHTPIALVGGGTGLVGLALGTLLGGLLQLLVQVPSASRSGFRFRFDFDWRDPGVRTILALMGPATIAASRP